MSTAASPPASEPAIVVMGVSGGGKFSVGVGLVDALGLPSAESAEPGVVVTVGLDRPLRAIVAEVAAELRAFLSSHPIHEKETLR